jgi:hypothetical protein
MAKFGVNDIAPGQRFEQLRGLVWQVSRLLNFAGEKVTHVQLFNVRDPATTKTLSAEVLLDPTRFTRQED